MNGDDQTTRALAREVGRHSVGRLNEGLTRITGEASGLFRWLLTMAFVLNAGGFWFCFAFPGSLMAGGPGELVTLFGVGALTAILAALVSLALTVPVARSMRQALTHWTEVSVSGALSDDAMLHSKRVKLTGQLWLGMTCFIGFLSFLLFGMGMAIATNGFTATRSVPAPSEEADLLNAAVNAAAPVENAANAAGNGAVNAALPSPSITRPTQPPASSAAPTRAVAPAQPAARPTSRPAPGPTPTARPPQPRPSATASTPVAPTPPPPVVVTPQPAPTATP